MQTPPISRRAITINEGFSRLGVFSSVPPLSFYDMLLVTRGRGGRGLNIWLFPTPLISPPSFLAWTWVLSFCSFFSPSIGCFVLIKFNRVSSQIKGFSVCKGFKHNRQNNNNSFLKVDLIIASLDKTYPKKKSSSSNIINSTSALV